MSTLVSLEQTDKFSLIKMDDGKVNALSFEMLAQLSAALDTAESADKVVIILGRPGKFSAGFDLSVMGQGGDAMMDLLRTGANLSLRLLRCPTPVVLGVSGHALAMGGLLCLSADYRLGVSGAYKIGLNEVAIGMTLPQFGVELARHRLTKPYFDRAVGLAQLFDATGAVQAGFLDEAVAEDALLERSTALAEQLADIDMVAHRQTKAKCREHLYPALESAIEKELGSS